MAEVNVAPVFTDNCVLQRNKPIRLWGTGNENVLVTVNIDDNVASTVVKNGTWNLFLSPMDACSGKELVVSWGNEKISFSNVAIGEVWIAGGQSNMEYELKNCTGGMEMILNDSPDVRFYYTPKYEYESDKYAALIKDTKWETFSDPGKERWSAVGYIFAKELSEKLGVTVGIIGCNWGGTSASAWMAEEDLREDEVLNVYCKEYDEFIFGKSFEEQEKQYEEYIEYRAWWEPECGKLYENNPNISWDEVLSKIGDPKYPGPVNECSPMRPGGLYKTMLSKVIPYTLAGVIFYQGESDDHRPEIYDRLFEKMIVRWRKDNGDENLHFLAVSLPMHKYSQDPDFKNWPIIRLNQRKVSRKLNNVGIAVCTDLGEFNEIHPRDKRVVAHRLFLQAVWLVYKKVTEKEANGPMVSNVQFERNKVTVFFSNAEDGLVICGELLGFEVAGTNEDGSCGEFLPVKGDVLDDKVVLECSQIDNPSYVRYLWTNYSKVCLFGRNGICAEPFFYYIGM